MTSDLFAEGQRRMHADVRPDWRQEMGRAYERYLRASHPAERDRWMREMVLSFSPLLYFLSYRYQNVGLGFSRRDAFDAAVPQIPAAIRRFDPDKHPGGTLGISAWVAHACEMTMLAAIKRLLRDAQRPSTCSLDALDTDDTVICLGVTDPEYQHRCSVVECIERGLSKLSPQDEWMSRRRLFDDMGWEAIARLGRDEDIKDITAEAWRQRWRGHVAGVLRHELERDGYDRSDIDGLDMGE